MEEDEEEIIRCSSIDDVPMINDAMGTNLVKPFRPTNILKLLEVSNIGVTIIKNEGHLVAHATFLDYPDFYETKLGSTDWVEWLSEKLGHTEYTGLNSLFLHLFLSRSENEFHLRKILKEVFGAAPFLQFCFLFLLEECEVDEAIRNVFIEQEIPGDDECQLWTTERKVHISQVLVRPAKAEDTEDVNELMELHTNVLQEMYGKYFLNDLLDTQDGKTLTVMAEADGIPVGFMHASCNVDVRLLNECFELECFYGLRKVHVNDEDIPLGIQPILQPAERSSFTQNEKVGSPNNERSSYFQRIRISSMNSRQGSSISGSPSRTSISLRRRLTSQRIQNPYHYAKASKSKTAVENKKEGPTKHSVPYLPLYIEPIVPKYNGDSNCFCIHLFSLREGYDSGSLEMIAAAFEKFPFLEYCVLLMPYTTTEFCLSRYFSRVSARPLSLFPHSLFLFHRAVLLFDFQVRICTESDLDGIKNLVSSLWGSDYLNLDLRLLFRAGLDVDNPDFQAFVAECQGQIVGVAILRDEDDLDYIRSHFQVDDFIVWHAHMEKDHGRLIHCILNPAFKLWSKLFLKEVLRLSRKSCLYYPVYPVSATCNESLWQSVITTFDDLVPLKPRKLIHYDLPRLFEFKPAEGICRLEDTYSVYHFNRKLTLSRKLTIDARLIVVGASETAFGFLESLIFHSCYQFANVTLISPCGIPSEMPLDKNRNAFLRESADYNQNAMDSLCLHSWVNIVYGAMTAIDRHLKVIQINRETEIAYDYLILCCGLQFQRPLQPQLLISQSGEALLRKTSSLEMRVGNVFVINDSYDAAIALNWLGDHYMDGKGHVIVYGNSIEAYICIKGLLDAGVMSLRIAFVKSPADKENPCFGVNPLENAMLEAMKANDIQLFDDYILELPDNKSAVNYVIIKCPAKERTLKCLALFLCKDKEVDHLAFKAIAEANIVFDGRLVVNSSFRTNDEFIYGAGTFTRLSHRYYAYHRECVSFNSKEIGSALAKKIVELFQPSGSKVINLDDIEDLANYKNPTVVHAKLPCDWHYACIDKPKHKYELLFGKSDFEKTHVKRITSGTLFGNDPSFLQLVFNNFNEVETIIVFAKEKIEVCNLRQLYGLHYAFLNKIFERFETKEVTKLLHFLREPWSMALYHDGFHKFKEDAIQMAYKRKHDDLLSLSEKVRLNLSMDPKLTEEKKKEIENSFKNLGYEDDVKELLRYYLSYYYPDLPMYSQRGWKEKYK